MYITFKYSDEDDHIQGRNVCYYCFYCYSFMFIKFELYQHA